MTPNSPEPPEHASDDTKHASLWEASAETWLNRIGGALLAIGALWFLRYAVEQGWLSVPVQLGIGAAAFTSLFAFGYRSIAQRARFAGEMMAAGLMGNVLVGGIATFVYAYVAPTTYLLAVMVLFGVSFWIAAATHRISVLVGGAIGTYATVIGFRTGSDLGAYFAAALMVSFVLLLWSHRTRTTEGLWVALAGSLIITPLAMDSFFMAEPWKVDIWTRVLAYLNLVAVWIGVAILPVFTLLRSAARPDSETLPARARWLLLGGFVSSAGLYLATHGACPATGRVGHEGMAAAIAALYFALAHLRFVRKTPLQAPLSLSAVLFLMVALDGIDLGSWLLVIPAFIAYALVEGGPKGEDGATQWAPIAKLTIWLAVFLPALWAMGQLGAGEWNDAAAVGAALGLSGLAMARVRPVEPRSWTRLMLHTGTLLWMMAVVLEVADQPYLLTPLFAAYSVAWLVAAIRTPEVRAALRRTRFTVGFFVLAFALVRLFSHDLLATPLPVRVALAMGLGAALLGLARWMRSRASLRELEDAVAAKEAAEEV